MTVQLELTIATQRERETIAMLSTMVCEGFAKGDSYLCNLSTAAAMCLGQAWSINPDLEGYRSPEQGPLHKRWHMTPEDLGPTFANSIRVRDEIPMCNAREKRLAVAYFAKELCQRFKPFSTVLDYHFRGILSVDLDIPDMIDQLRLFDFMLVEIDTHKLAQDPTFVLEWFADIKNAIKGIEFINPSEELCEETLKIGHDVLGLGACMLYLLTPTPMP